ncbi:MAG: hypothetical protein K8R48_09450 [Alphaproteobacteria bacterium]|nr:hypothetical protein [Alphaproteobacteria bacterium]
MSAACQCVHKTLAMWPRFRAGFNPKELPRNGLYFLFEKGEIAHGGERIVRVGTHTGQNNLPKRLHEHLYTPNKDRSIFRKHIGRCLLARQSDLFLAFWELDLTTKKQREKSGYLVDKKRLAEVEKDVSDYINENFSFAVLPVEDKENRLRIEAGMLSTIAQCSECIASAHWLGRHHPNPVIRESGLWNIQGLKGDPFSQTEIEALLTSQGS